MVAFDQEASAKKTDRSESVVLDMEIISSQVSDDGDCTSLPAMNRSLSRKASNWLERKTCEERDSDTSFSIKGGEHSTTGTESRSVGLRRYMNGGRRTSTWLDPRRVLLFFATLSSMGTILLIYFTLSTTNINGDDGNVFQS